MHLLSILLNHLTFSGLMAATAMASPIFGLRTRENAGQTLKKYAATSASVLFPPSLHLIRLRRYRVGSLQMRLSPCKSAPSTGQNAATCALSPTITALSLLADSLVVLP